MSLCSLALLQTLAAKGSLGQMKARIRSEIFSALDQNDEAGGGPSSKAPLSNTNLLLNELIREYMAFNQYRYSLSVFLPETNQPEVPPFDRNFIAKELHVQENAHSVQMSVGRSNCEQNEGTKEVLCDRLIRFLLYCCCAQSPAVLHRRDAAAGSRSRVVRSLCFRCVAR